MNSKENTKQIKIITLLFLFLSLVIILATFSKNKVINAFLPTLEVSELSKYNGSNLDLPVYLAFEGYVYDVSSGRIDYYNEGKPYHYLAGRDSTSELNIMGGNIIKSKYKIIAKLSF